MELLIVIAIIVVLVAIAIPVFNAQLEKAREATDMANIRAAYAEVSAELIMNDKTDASKDVAVTQTKDNWQTKEDATSIDIGGIQVKAKTSGNWKVAVDTTKGEVTIDGVGATTTTTPAGGNEEGGN